MEISYRNDFRYGLIIQGDLRIDINILLDFFRDYFDVIIVSSWFDQELEKIKKDKKVHVLKSFYPENSGYTNRNYQRATVAPAIHLAKKLKVTHIMKWRSDMLPVHFDIYKLTQYCYYKPQPPFTSRIVIPSYRCISMKEDHFSSICDLFCFGETEMIDLLWNDLDFNYDLDYNFPFSKALLSPYGESEIIYKYCPESELYSLFRTRLEMRFNISMNHRMIIKNAFFLIDHKKIGLCWFTKDYNFRAINPVPEIPWWTIWRWKYDLPRVVKNYDDKTLIEIFIQKFLKDLFIRLDIERQRKTYSRYLIRKKSNRGDHSPANAFYT